MARKNSKILRDRTKANDAGSTKKSSLGDARAALLDAKGAFKDAKAELREVKRDVAAVTKVLTQKSKLVIRLGKAQDKAQEKVVRLRGK